MEAERFDVFLSYKSSDRTVVERIAGRLERAGIKPWFDQWHIPPGGTIRRALEEGLRASRCCAVFIGPDQFGAWTEEELDVVLNRSAREKSFWVIPVLLPGVPATFPPGSISAFLENRSWVDFRDGFHAAGAFQQLVDAIKGTTVHARSNGGYQQNGGQHQPESHVHPELAQVSYLFENIPILQQHIRDLSFTPVLGAGCSLIGRSEGHAWKAIAEQMNRLLDLLNGGEPATKYVRSLAGVPAYGIGLDPHRASSAPSAPPEPLELLQVTLARVGAALGSLFAETMLASATAVWDTISYSVAIPPDHPELEHALSLLLEACVAARDVRSTHEAREIAHGLGAHGLYDHLIALTCELAAGRDLSNLGGSSTIDAGVLQDIRSCRRRIRLLDDGSAARLELSIHQLEWITDALWHTFRYDKSAYPRTDELAFQVSLMLTGAHGRRPELGAAAEFGHVILSAHAVAAWFHRFGGAKAKPMIEFYDVLARILTRQFEAFAARRSSRSRDEGDGSKPVQPIAFSTNYDLELEDALRRSEQIDAFHVILPVNAYLSGDGQPRPEWLLATIRKHGRTERTEWQWFPIHKDTMHPREIEGPIVVKLHGSPLVHLPDPDEVPPETSDGDVIDEYVRFEHALVLSEGQYLHTIVWKDTMPKFLNNALLQSHRSLFFLGHSMKEWSTRLRLYNHVYRPGHAPTGTQRVAINRSHDPYRSAVLGTIGVHRWIGDLSEIPGAAEAVLDQG